MPDVHHHKPLLRALAGEILRPPPIWLMRQAGRYLSEYRRLRQRAGSFLDLCLTPELAAEATLQPVTRFAMDGAILFSDILVVPLGLGREVRFDDRVGPRVEPLRDAADVARLRGERVCDRLGPVYEAVATIKRSLGEQTALIGFAGAPWTVATYMVEGGTSKDFSRVKRWALAEPESFQELIDRLVVATVDHLVAQVEAGAEVVQIFDSWAGVLPAVAFDRWCVEPTRALVKAFRVRAPGVPVIGFARGAGLAIERYLDGTEVDCVSLDSTVSVAWAAATLQRRCVVQGNIDPVYLLAPTEIMARATKAVVRGFAAGPHVFNLGHGVLPMTSPEAVGELVRTVREA